MKRENFLTSPVPASFSRTVLDGVIKLDANSLNNPENVYRLSFPGLKRPERGVDHPLPSSVEVKERVELYLYSPSVPSWPVLGRTVPLPLPRKLPITFLPFITYAFDKHIGDQKAIN